MGRWTEWVNADLTERQMLSSTAHDLDNHDADFASLTKRLDRMNGILVGILISVATSAIMLALNLVVAK